MRTTIGVTAHFLQGANAKGLGRIRKRDTKAGMVLMIAGPFNL